MTDAGTRGWRSAALAAVLAVHAVMIALLLWRQADRLRAPTPAAERIVWLAPASAVAPRRLPPTAGGKTRRPSYAGPDYRGIALSAEPPPAAATDGLGHALFDCQGQDLSRLSAERRAHCAGSIFAAHPGSDDDVREPRERSVAAARWARGRARKNAPLLLPCMSPQAAGIGLGTLLCLGKGAIDGFDLDAMPGYGDSSEQVHVPNGGDPPDKPN